MSQPRRPTLSFAGAVSTLVLAITGCSQGQSSGGNTVAAAANVSDAAPPLAALPLATGAPPSSGSAPAVLPSAPPARYGEVRPDLRYAYLDRAYALSHAFADAPPDYTYDFQGERPWVWRTNDGYERVAERFPDGRLRYSYFQPGAEQPFMVQDPDYAYAYSDGQLAAVYGLDGRLLPADVAEQREEAAGRYLTWAAALYVASQREQREAVAQANWERAREAIYNDRQRWAADQDQIAAWQTYHQAHWNEEQAHWAAESYRRSAEAARYAQGAEDQTGAARATQAAAAAYALTRQQNQTVSAPLGPLPGQAPTLPHRPAAPPTVVQSSPPAQPPLGERQAPPATGAATRLQPPPARPVGSPPASGVAHAVPPSVHGATTATFQAKPNPFDRAAPAPHAPAGASPAQQPTPQTTARPQADQAKAQQAQLHAAAQAQAAHQAVVAARVQQDAQAQAARQAAAQTRALQQAHQDAASRRAADEARAGQAQEEQARAAVQAKAQAAQDAAKAAHAQQQAKVESYAAAQAPAQPARAAASHGQRPAPAGPDDKQKHDRPSDRH